RLAGRPEDAAAGETDAPRGPSDPAAAAPRGDRGDAAGGHLRLWGVADCDGALPGWSAGGPDPVEPRTAAEDVVRPERALGAVSKPGGQVGQRYEAPGPGRLAGDGVPAPLRRPRPEAGRLGLRSRGAPVRRQALG